MYDHTIIQSHADVIYPCHSGMQKSTIGLCYMHTGSVNEISHILSVPPPFIT